MLPILIKAAPSLSDYFFLVFLIVQIKVCTSARLTGCEEITVISNRLKIVYSEGEIHIVEDIKLTVDIIEKIVAHIDLSNIEKVPQVGRN